MQTELSIELNPMQWIVGGYREYLEQLQQLLSHISGCQYQYLQVNIASHTSLMSNAAPAFTQYLQQWHAKHLNIPIISATQGQKVDSVQQGIMNLTYQIHHPLNWYTALNILKEYQPNVVIELGCGNALSRMVQQRLASVTTRSIDDFQSFYSALQWFKYK